MGSLAVYGRALDTRVRRPFRSSWLGGALLRRGSLCAPSATYIRAVRSLSLIDIFAFTMPKSARSGASAQRTTRAAARANRTAAAALSPANRVDESAGSDGTPAGAAAAGVATPASAGSNAVGSPGYLADFPALGSPPSAASDRTPTAVPGNGGPSVSANAARVAKARKAGAKAAKAAKSVSANGRDVRPATALPK